MVRQESALRTILIPDKVTVNVDGRRVSVKGPLGALAEDLSHLPVGLAQQDGKVVITTQWPRKRELGMLGTAAAHVRNMVRGVTEGYRYKLTSVYAHFPITVKVEDKTRQVRIENFTGEKTPRFANIVGNARVVVKGEDIIVEGPSLADVSQTAANIQNSTKIKKKDQRVFLDGIYISGKEAATTPTADTKQAEKKKGAK